MASMIIYKTTRLLCSSPTFSSRLWQWWSMANMLHTQSTLNRTVELRHANIHLVSFWGKDPRTHVVWILISRAIWFWLILIIWLVTTMPESISYVACSRASMQEVIWFGVVRYICPWIYLVLEIGSLKKHVWLILGFDCLLVFRWRRELFLYGWWVFGVEKQANDSWTCQIMQKLEIDGWMEI